LFGAGTVESVRHHDFFGIGIEIGIEALLSGHAGSNNTGSWGLSTTCSTSVRPIDPDPDSDFEQHHLGLLIYSGLHGTVLGSGDAGCAWPSPEVSLPVLSFLTHARAIDASIQNLYDLAGAIHPEL
jgi:hypothetical protein